MKGLVDASRRRARSTGPRIFVPGRLYGVRKWNLNRSPNDEIRLSGHGGCLWRASGETTWAECRRRGGEATHAPSQSAPVGPCTCGLYAWHPWATIRETAESKTAFALESVSGSLDVLGIVEAWGAVHVHREGFRAQYARPVSLVLLGSPRSSEFGRLVADLAISHHAQLLEFAGPRALVDHCEAEGIGIPRSTVEPLLSWRSPKGMRVDGTG